MGRGEQAAGSKIRFGQWVLLGFAAHFLLVFATTAGYLASLQGDNLGLEAQWLLLRGSTLRVGLAFVAFLLLPRAGARWALPREFLAYAALFGLFVSYGEIFASYSDLLSRLALLLPGVIGAIAVGLASRAWSSRAARLLLAGASAIAVAAGGISLSSYDPFPLHEEGYDPEAHPLVSFKRSRVEEVDGSTLLSRDGYPQMVFRYNSLGFRDLEPVANLAAGQQRILVVGDSFVWGDGIATNEETVSHRLREALEVEAPGRFVVMSAAYPGTGIHGSRRLVQEMTARYPASLAVVGYLGESDFDPVDAQYLMESFPGSPFLRRLIMGLRISQHFHEISVTHDDAFWYSEKNRRYMERTLQAMVDEGRAAGRKLLFLDYMHPSPSPRPEGATVMVLPPKLRYPGHRNEYWYEMDFHPKAKLNKILGGLLAKEVLALRPPSPPTD